MKVTTLFILMIVLIAGCSQGGQKTGVPPQPMAVPVAVGTVVKKDVPVQVQAVGTVEATSTVTIKPQVGGVLTKVHFQEGQDVKKGDLLFTIDPRPLQADLAKAQANMAKDVAQARTARELAKRYETLVKKDYVTQEQYDQVRTNAEAFEASANADRSAVENAQLMLNYCTIRSALTGRTGNLLVHEGNVVKANETELIEIHQVDPINVRFSVPEQYLSDIKKYKDEGTLKIEAMDKSGNQKVFGTLSFINNEVDHATGTILLKGSFANTTGVLWPGQFTNVTLTLSTRPGAIVVPTQAVESGQNGQFVFVIKQDMTAEMRPVQVGLSIGQETVIENGLQPGERVVTDGQSRLLPGAKVEIKNPQRASL